MKHTCSVLVALALIAAGGCEKAAPESRATKRPPTFSSFDATESTNAVATGLMNFREADLEQVLDVYAALSRRTVIRSPQVPASVKITFRNASPLSTAEALQALDTVLAGYGIVMVYLGTKYVKAVPAPSAPTEPGPVVEVPWRELPESSSYLTYIVHLNWLPAEQATSLLQPFARLPNSIVAMKGSDLLILRDYSANVRRMCEVLEEADRSPGLKKAAEQMFKPGPGPGGNPRPR